MDTKDIKSAHTKLKHLKTYLATLENLAVGFSGGVDSSFLLKLAADVLGKRALAITAVSLVFPKRELSESIEFTKKFGVRQILMQTNILENENFVANDAERCYYCKKATFSKIKALAKENGFTNIAEGSNMDDLGDYRPGLKAAAEVGALSPLREAKLTKAEIRYLSKEMGLNTFKKPSFACLATRIPYGDKITAEKLQKIEEAEQLLFDLGFSQFRVRLCGDIARIELLPEEMMLIFKDNRREKITEKLKSLGFSYVTLDLAGFKSGNLNSALNLDI